MRPHPRQSARAEYRVRESERVQQSTSLASEYPNLKSLTVELMFYHPDGVSRNGQIKYSVNVANAKSVFRIDCVNRECIRGDFDLSAELAKAANARRREASGELCCQGWDSKADVSTLRCGNILRYKISLGY